MSDSLVVLTHSDITARMLKRGSYYILRIRDVEELSALCKHDFWTPSLIVDLDASGASGSEGIWDLIRTIRAMLPITTIVCIAQRLETRRVVEVIRAGASRFVTKEQLANDFESAFDSELTGIGEHRKKNNDRDLFADNPDIDAFAASRRPVLIIGEAHLGTARLARLIHSRSMERDLPFVRIRCGSMKPDLGRRELMGYERGSCVGAFRSCKGALAEAGSGTILFEGLHLLDPVLQKLIEEVIVSGIVIPCGGLPVPFEARVIATSHLSFEVMKVEGISPDLMRLFTENVVQSPTLSVRRDEIVSIGRDLPRKPWAY